MGHGFGRRGRRRRGVSPIVDATKELAVVGPVVDATAFIATIEAARRDVMLVTLAAGLLLAAMLFLIFRSAQARLSRSTSS